MKKTAFFMIFLRLMTCFCIKGPKQLVQKGILVYNGGSLQSGIVQILHKMAALKS